MRDEKSNIREELEDKIQEIQQQMEPAAEVVKVKPRPGEGVQGSRKIVKKMAKFIYTIKLMVNGIKAKWRRDNDNKRTSIIK